MNRIILLALLCFFCIQGVSSQDLNFEEKLSPEEAEEYYTMRYKNKRGTARGFLFSGVGLIVIGSAVLASSDGWDGALGGAGLFTIGTVSSLVSIPFYIKAGSFKRKAQDARTQMSVSFGTIRSPQRKDVALGVSFTF